MNATVEEQGLVFAVSAEEVTSLTISGISGSIVVEGWDRPAIQISSEDEETVEELAEILNIEQQGNALSISLDPGSHKQHRGRHGRHEPEEGDWGGFKRMLRQIGRSVNMDLTLRVPYRCDLTLRTASGDMEVRRIRGKVFIQSASGDVEMEDIEGSVLVKSASSDVTIARLRGRLGVRSMSGDLDVTEAELAALSIGTVSGDLSIAAALHPGAEYDIQTVSGEVQMFMPPSVQATVGVTTVSGDIECALRHEAVREGRRSRRLVINGGAEVALRIQTTSGDINVLPGKDLVLTGPAPIVANGGEGEDDEVIPNETRRFSAEEGAQAAAALGGEAEHFRLTPAAAQAVDPTRTQRLNRNDAPRQSPEMVILEAIESGAMTVDEGLRRLTELAQ